MIDSYRIKMIKTIYVFMEKNLNNNYSTNRFIKA